MSFVSKSGLTPNDVDGFNGNTSQIHPTVIKNTQDMNQDEILKNNRLIETQNIYSISALKRILSDRHFQLEVDNQYGLCLKYGHIIVYLSVKRAHIRFNNANFNAKDGLQYDNDEGGLNTQILSGDENNFLQNVEKIFSQNPDYIYVNHEGEITKYCSNNANIPDHAPVNVENTAWQIPE